MRWIVTGSGGQLGRCLVRQLRADPDVAEVVACSHAEADLAEPAGLAARCQAWKLGPGDVVANAAAHTGVDACEAEVEAAMAVNAAGPAVLAHACNESGAHFVHVSTDYVFDGKGDEPYRESHPPAPTTVYGRTKLEGEARVLAACSEALIIRTSWVFGPGRNFVGAILRQAQLRRTGEVAGPLSVVDDQRGCPTYAADLAEGLRALQRAGAKGVLHLSNAEPTTWWGFARAILDETGYGDLEVERGSTAALDLPAPRPAYSVLDCSRAAARGVSLRPWREALSEYLQSEDSPVTGAGSA